MHSQGGGAGLFLLVGLFATRSDFFATRSNLDPENMQKQLKRGEFFTLASIVTLKMVN